MSKQQKIILILIILFFGLGAGYYFGYDIGFEKAANKPTTNYKDPTRQSPTQYKVQDFGYSDLITVDYPVANQKISSPVQISGQARGSWYFEAEFPIELVDENGVSLGTSIAKAQGEWMTEDFVPFNSELSFSAPTTKTGRLIVKNANPSDLPENSKELVIPVTF